MKNLAYLLLVMLSISTLSSCDKSDEVTDNNRNEVVSYSKDAPMPQYYQSGNGWGLNNIWDDVLGDCRSNPVNCFDPIIIIADAIATLKIFVNFFIKDTSLYYFFLRGMMNLPSPG